VHATVPQFVRERLLELATRVLFRLLCRSPPLARRIDPWVCSEERRHKDRPWSRDRFQRPRHIDRPAGECARPRHFPCPARAAAPQSGRSTWSVEHL